jgi:Asp-tRNA(Asn)/Glu-tRNA(Gln) amidotransferase A subunit family amidase
MSELATLSALEAAAKVRAGEASAREIVEATLARIAALNPKLGAFTDVTATRALAKADALDAAKARGEALGPLAGATFAVKNLFDVEGLPTRAGSKINRERAPASADATLITKLEASGAILVGALNMGEYAYDFTGENAHDGPSRNPHDLVGRLGVGGRRWAGPAGAGVRHQWVDPRALSFVRRLWAEADLWAAVAGAVVPLRVELRSSGAVRALGRRSGGVL